MENAKKFYEALKKDTAMQERANKLAEGLNSSNEAEMIAATVEFAEKEGYSVTADEVKAYASEPPKHELSDEQLSDVAGGAGLFEKTTDEFSVCPKCQSRNVEWKYNNWLFFKDWYTVCNSCGFSGKDRR